MKRTSTPAQGHDQVNKTKGFFEKFLHQLQLSGRVPVLMANTVAFQIHPDRLLTATASDLVHVSMAIWCSGVVISVENEC